jgi:hypothetical protein
MWRGRRAPASRLSLQSSLLLLVAGLALILHFTTRVGLREGEEEVEVEERTVLLLASPSPSAAPTGHWWRAPDLEAEPLSETEVETRLNRTSRDTCLIHRCGVTGFGHQLEGQWTLMAVAEMFPERFTYFWNPFEPFPHTPMSPARVRDFFGFHKMFPSKTDYEKAWNVRFQFVRPPVPSELFLVEVLENRTRCAPNHVYCIDNAWSITHQSAAHARQFHTVIRNSTLFRKLRHVYWEGKPSVPQTPRPQVVIHVRRGDAADPTKGTVRLADVRYYEQAADYVRNLLGATNPLFMIHTDEPQWEGISRLLKHIGGDAHVVYQKTVDSVLETFHALVSADVAILSYSNLGYSAIPFRVPRLRESIIIEDKVYDELHLHFQKHSPLLHRITVEPHN